MDNRLKEKRGKITPLYFNLTLSIYVLASGIYLT